MEQALLAQEWQRLIILRPAMLLGHREPARRSEQIIQAIYPLVKPLLRGRAAGVPSRPSQVAHAMARLAIQGERNRDGGKRAPAHPVMPRVGRDDHKGRHGAPLSANPSPVRCRHRLACGAHQAARR